MSVEAKYYSKNSKKGVACLLCPFLCNIKENKFGRCNVRVNENGVLFAKSHSRVTSLNLDPIEKKPLYHFYPGSKILSIGSYGCNFKCNNCQNWEIAQCNPRVLPNYKYLSPDDLVNVALQQKESVGVAFTYNEPVIWFEYILELAPLLKNNNLKTVLVSNGYINKQPLKELLPFIDAFNIDVKGFSKKFYKSYLQAKFKPLLKNLEAIKKYNKHLEITFLLIPNVSDNESDFKQMVSFIKNNLGSNTPLHISRYFPRYKSTMAATDPKDIHHFYSIAKSELPYVYMGNLQSNEGGNTHCGNCNTLLIERKAYATKIIKLNDDGSCGTCGASVAQM
jgi:pyruvate formate lyase activating enzyme